MDDSFKVAAFEAILFARRIKSVDVSEFLRFVEKTCAPEEVATIRALVYAVIEKKPEQKRAAKQKFGAAQDVYAREIRAILSDVNFLPAKRDLLYCLRAVFGPVPDSLAKKGSRDAIVDWALRELSLGSESERHSKYRAIRQMFLKRRDSSLQDWADIFSKPSR